MYRPM